MNIGGIDLDKEVLVVAEIGNNHEGNIAVAEELITRAAHAGAQAVKFQTIVPERLVTPDQTSRLEQLRRFAFTGDQFLRLAAKARDCGVLFLSTPFDRGSVDMLDPLVPAFKIASGDNNFLPLLERVAATGKPVLLSTGMADDETIRQATETLRRVWHGAEPGLVLLHCVAAYPTPIADANLRAIPALAAHRAVPGYSDHTLGIDAALLAVALGARVIEKHFTLHHAYSEFRDHKLSADPLEMAELVRRVREAEAMLGDGVKRLMPSETATAAAARRSVAAARDLATGDTIAPADLTWLRGTGGLPPGQESALIGRRLRRPVAAGTVLLPDWIE